MKLALLVLVASATPVAAKTWSLRHGDPADCGKLHEANTEVPAWSRLSWSVASGASLTENASVGVVVPQVSYAFWLRERRCEPSTSLLFREKPWLRWSAQLSADAKLRFDGSYDLRPALRFSRARMDGFIGSKWTPSFDLFATVGPTFEDRFTGVGGSAGVRFTVLFAEVRVDGRADDRGTEALLVIGLADLHGLARIGRRR
jgi:hypothetical protein